MTKLIKNDFKLKKIIIIIKVQLQSHPHIKKKKSIYMCVYNEENRKGGIK